MGLKFKDVRKYGRRKIHGVVHKEECAVEAPAYLLQILSSKKL